MFSRLPTLYLFIIFLVAPTSKATPPVGFGNQWVRQRPFTIMGLNINQDFLDVPEYIQVFFTALLAWQDGNIPGQVSVSSQGNLPWHAHIRPASQGPDAYLQNLVNSAAAVPGALGWLLQDEPGRSDMPGIGQAAAWIRQQYPETLVYGNAFPSYASTQQLLGTDSVPNYSWEQYLDDFITMINPDVMMYDHYPFRSDGTTGDTYFRDLMTIRAKALDANIPYWTFIQSWQDGNSRLPSESDLRMQVFSSLAAGFSGIAYFTYDYFQQGGLLDQAGDPTPLFYTAATVNEEVLHLAHSLRFLTSTGVRFLPGQYMMLGIWLVDNPTPEGLQNFSGPDYSLDPHMVAADVDSSNPQNYGKEKSGLLGFFVDDNAQHYFMMVNLAHAATESAQDAALPLFVEFDNTVDELLELDRETGQQVVVPLTNHRLEVTLLGGSARLYKYNNGPFAPDEEGDADGYDGADGEPSVDDGYEGTEEEPVYDDGVDGGPWEEMDYDGGQDGSEQDEPSIDAGDDAGPREEPMADDGIDGGADGRDDSTVQDQIQGADENSDVDSGCGCTHETGSGFSIVAMFLFMALVTTRERQK